MQPSSINLFLMLLKTLIWKSTPKTLAEFGEICKAVKENFIDDHFSHVGKCVLNNTGAG